MREPDDVRQLDDCQRRVAVPPEHGPDRLVELGGAVLVDATRVAPCPVQSMTLRYLTEVLEFGEARRRVGGEDAVGEVGEKGFVGELPLVREHCVLEICSDDIFNKIPLLDKTLSRQEADKVRIGI